MEILDLSRDVFTRLASLGRQFSVINNLYKTAKGYGIIDDIDNDMFEQMLMEATMPASWANEVMHTSEADYPNYLFEEHGYDLENIRDIQQSPGGFIGHKLEWAQETLLEAEENTNDLIYQLLALIDGHKEKLAQNPVRETWAQRALKMKSRARRNYHRVMALIASLQSSRRYPREFSTRFSHELEAYNIQFGSGEEYLHEGKMKNALKFFSRAANMGDRMIWVLLQKDAWIRKHGRHPDEDENEMLDEELWDRSWAVPDPPSAYYGGGTPLEGGKESW